MLVTSPWLRYGSLAFVVFVLSFLFVPNISFFRPSPVSWPVDAGKANVVAETHPTVPSTTAFSKTIVVGKTQAENTTWVEDELSDWQNAIYTVDNPTASLHSAINKGREATPYLTYILTHYDNLPDIILFLHSHRDGEVRAWHVDNEGHSNVRAAKELRLDYVKQEGFVNLRCISIPGCDKAVQPYRDPPLPDRPAEQAMPQAWKELFPDVEMPREIAAPCCAQFAVTREQVLKRSRKEYEHYYNWVTTTELTDYVSGRVMEYLWHIVFGKDSFHCPTQSSCYCNVYGRC